MISRMWRPFKPNEDGQLRKKLPTNSKHDQGLRTLIQLPTPNGNHKDSNIVLKYGLALVIKPIFFLNRSHEGSIVSCFLKSCHLCKKTLRLDKEVFMYRGDQGFCSEKCRDRQIYLDEIKELESSTKKTLALYRSCRDEVSPWRRNKHIGRTTTNDRVIFSLS
ncbi:hypothetical protein Leryth_012137 [Lithospermum erythrorhizon]|nr:hypothetical protein Leryth_012137 [Lithospermum erythrorhizon]